MMISEAPETLKEFRSTPWEFQQTFLTPLQNLQGFVTAIASADQDMKSGCVTIEQAVFEPKHLINLLASHSIPPRYNRGTSLAATEKQEVETLLHAVFSDWIDFLFVPEPKPFAIYADHDEYTTFFAHTRPNLDRVVKMLVDGGFKIVSGYERRL